MAREPARRDDNRGVGFRDTFESLRSEVNNLFDGFFGRGGSALRRAWGEGGTGRLVPDLDVKETASEISIEAELPGLDEKDVSVTVQNGMLSIKGEKSSERRDEKEDYRVMERRYGSFQRTVPLPQSIDEDRIEAKFEKGVLRITAPKRPDAVQRQRQIEVKRADL